MLDSTHVLAQDYLLSQILALRYPLHQHLFCTPASHPKTLLVLFKEWTVSSRSGSGVASTACSSPLKAGLAQAQAKPDRSVIFILAEALGLFHSLSSTS